MIGLPRSVSRMLDCFRAQLSLPSFTLPWRLHMKCIRNKIAIILVLAFDVSDYQPHMIFKRVIRLWRKFFVNGIRLFPSQVQFNMSFLGETVDNLKVLSVCGN